MVFLYPRLMFLFPAVLLFSLFSPTNLTAHTHWIDPEPRLNEDLKISPCGGVERGTPSAEWTGGDTVTLSWEEFINHPGFFTLYFSEGDEGQFEKIVEIQDSLQTGMWEYQYVVPDMECNSCILQVIQTMLNTNPPTFYHSCADITITPAPVSAMGKNPSLDPETIKKHSGKIYDLKGKTLAWPPPEPKSDLRVSSTRKHFQIVFERTDKTP